MEEIIEQQVDVIVAITYSADARLSRERMLHNIVEEMKEGVADHWEGFNHADNMMSMDTVAVEVLSLKEECEIMETDILYDKKIELLDEVGYLFSKINWGASALDAKAIEIMNELKSKIKTL